MSTPLNLMVLESHPGAADRAVARLEAAGHSVHRCHDGDGEPFPCNGLAEGASCPADRGMDVALVVRRGIAPRPTPGEDGVTCALRAGIPLVEDGPDVLDPYSPFLTERVWADDDVVEVCEQAAVDGLAPLAEEVRRSLEPFLTSEGRDADSVRVLLRSSGEDLRVELVGDGLDAHLAGLLSVKALEHLRSAPRRWTRTEVSVIGAAPER